MDSGGGLAAGVLVLLFRRELSAIEALPEALLLFTGAANVGYGLYSGSLLRGVPAAGALRALVVANAVWAGLCALLAAGALRAGRRAGVRLTWRAKGCISGCLRGWSIGASGTPRFSGSGRCGSRAGGDGRREGAGAAYRSALRPIRLPSLSLISATNWPPTAVFG